MTVSDLLEQLVTSLIIMPSSLLQVVNSLFQTCHNKLGTSREHNLLTTCEQLQFFSRLVITCAFLHVYDFIFVFHTRAQTFYIP